MTIAVYIRPAQYVDALLCIAVEFLGETQITLAWHCAGKAL